MRGLGSLAFVDKIRQSTFHEHRIGLLAEGYH